MTLPMTLESATGISTSGQRTGRLASSAFSARRALICPLRSAMSASSLGVIASKAFRPRWKVSEAPACAMKSVPDFT